MSRQRFLRTWILLSILHFATAFGTLGFNFATLSDWFLGIVQPTHFDNVMWVAAKVLFQPGEALRQLFEPSAPLLRSSVF